MYIEVFIGYSKKKKKKKKKEEISRFCFSKLSVQKTCVWVNKQLPGWEGNSYTSSLSP